MITRIKIDGYKSFKDFELQMKPLMVLFGPNTSGKSNLLDALRLISLVGSEKDMKDVFKKHRGRAKESLWRKEMNLSSSSSYMRFEADVNLNDDVCNAVEDRIFELRSGLDHAKQDGKKVMINERNLRYSFELEVQSSGATRVTDERLCALTKRSPRKERARNPFIEKVEDKIRIRKESQSHPIFQDVGLDRSVLSTSLYPPHHPHMETLKEELTRWKFYYFEPGKIMREKVPESEVDSIGERGEDLAGFFYTLKNRSEKNFRSARQTARKLIPGIEDFDVKLDKRDAMVELVIKESRGDFSSALISEGTLKILGMLAIFHSLTPPALIGDEGPENGVHPERLHLIAETFKNLASYQGCQVIVNTHSPEFVELFDDENLFSCRKEEGVTTIEPLGEIKPLFRKNQIKDRRSDIPRVE